MIFREKFVDIVNMFEFLLIESNDDVTIYFILLLNYGEIALIFYLINQLTAAILQKDDIMSIYQIFYELKL